MNNTTQNELTPFEKLTSDDFMKHVSSVYNGKKGCCCGCNGKHRYNSTMVEAESKRRGYEVTPDEVNDRQIKKIVNLLRTNWPLVEVDDQYREHAALEMDGKLYIVYFAEKASA
jgi:hypothetical protein